ncbi:hypothetical protein [Paenibacillus beijingensis]|uniref:Uncharacterized protein n=1 Tax=Paenibacillus beijingensis TaxID=1126833 RepID=A0A0D5NK03_9BACL|nr:hypothetical protein [Paenibacillus beijingensis]AJY75460.1 hypothetical protein VN24_13885 [Paenibacillus beijingensis]
MKRYALSILLGLLIVAGVGSYYVYNAADRLPQYRLMTLEGNADEAAKIELSGHYGGRMRSESLTVGIDGSDYSSRESVFSKSFFGARRWFTERYGMKQLIAEHRQFMRGKGWPFGFYKDKEWLIYVQPAILNRDKPAQRAVLNVSLLHLDSGKSQNFETIVGGGPSFISGSYDVQRLGNELHIVAAQSYWPEQSADHTADSLKIEYYDYVVNMTSGQLIREVKLDPGFVNTKEIEYRIDVATGSNNVEPSAYCLLVVNENKVWTNEHGKNSERIAAHLYSYSYKTGQLTALPETLSEGKLGPRFNYSLTGNQLYSHDSSPGIIRLKTYNLETGVTGKEMTITAKQLGADKIDNAVLEDDRLYILMHRSRTALAAVVNAMDGTVLYKGEAVYNGPKKEAAANLAHLNLLNIGLKH